MVGTDAGRRRFLRIALWTAGLTVLLFGVGGFVRGTGSGLGCETWPKCGPDRWLPYWNFASLVEYAHRTVAAIVATMIGVQLLAAWRHVREDRLLFRGSVLAMPLVLGQAGLGGVVVLTELNPWWLTFHFATAMALIATVVTVATGAVLRLGDREPLVPLRAGFVRVAIATAGATLLLLLVGTYVRATDAGLAFGDWPLMGGSLLPPLGGIRTSMFLHRLVALVAGLLVLWTFIRSRVAPRSEPVARLAAWSLALISVQMLVGAAQIWTLLEAWTVAAHVAGSAAVWALLVSLVVVVRQSGIRVEEGQGATARADARSMRDVVTAYVRLTKPRIVVLLLITTVPAMVLAQGGLPSPLLVLATLLGGSLAAGAANAINCYLDRDIDRIMRRTRGRPLPAHEIDPDRALAFGYVLAAIAFVFLGTTVNVLSALLALAAIAIYVFVYTMWLKRTSTQNIVIGGAAGAVPPLIGWAAVTGEVALPAWILFAIVFVWTPPHFWALAMRHRAEYAEAGVPMLPVVAGEAETRRQILAYSLVLFVASLALVPAAPTGPIYLVAAVLLGGAFVHRAFRLLRRDDAAEPMRLFRFSLVYLAALFAAVALDAVAPFAPVV